MIHQLVSLFLRNQEKIMFYCREEELKTMNRRYEKGRFECIVIYGRRRVGKTALINEFCKDKPIVYFSALSASSQENPETLSKAIYSCKNPDSTIASTYQRYDDALCKKTAFPAKWSWSVVGNRLQDRKRGSD